MALSLLHSNVVSLYSAGLSLLAAFMRTLSLHQSKVRGRGGARVKSSVQRVRVCRTHALATWRRQQHTLAA